ncbi:MAG: acetyl-CoA acetyltransferase [Alphaproteobacteria bacterium 41-28]|nr:MAG: acetyl-CoA acetyltransferase [Alphaproteobacteria bacterium 41-28]
MTEEVMILGAKRTPIGSFQGELSSVKATQLGSIAIQGALQDASLAPSQVEEVLMGCVLSAGLGQAPARQAAIGAGIPTSTPCTTINKICGSAMKAVMFAASEIRLKDIDVAVAGGMESMTNAPYLLDKARSGYRMGHGRIFDHMFLDGLEDAYDHCQMGCFAEEAVQKYKFSRQAQDEFAISSGLKALKSIEDGTFAAEIVPVRLDLGKTTINVTQDEGPFRLKIDRVPTLKPSFKEGGTITAANSSSISDGAAALVLASRSYVDHHKLKPRAVIRGYTSRAQKPEWFTTAPITAIQDLLDQLGWKIGDVDLFEINEAFAVVVMVAIADLHIPPEKVNVYGGATALGHPIGASGARIIVTLLNALERKGLRRGIASLCIGGGEATAIAIERV